jgi:hypothetical protein
MSYGSNDVSCTQSPRLYGRAFLSDQGFRAMCCQAPKVTIRYLCLRMFRRNVLLNIFR